MDLPCEQEVGLDAYVAAVVGAVGDRRDDLVIVAQSLAGFIAPLVCTQLRVELMVLVAAMVRRDVERGRDELNFSEWQDDEDEADDAIESLEDGSMPPSRYEWLHADARLSDEEIDALIVALEAMDDDVRSGS